MTNKLKVTVSIPNHLIAGDFKELFNTTIECDSSVYFEFNKLIDAFNILYPFPNLIIQFTLM